MDEKEKGGVVTNCQKNQGESGAELFSKWQATDLKNFRTNIMNSQMPIFSFPLGINLPLGVKNDELVNINQLLDWESASSRRNRGLLLNPKIRYRPKRNKPSPGHQNKKAIRLGIPTQTSTPEEDSKFKEQEMN